MKLDELSKAHHVAGLRDGWVKNRTTLNQKVASISVRMESQYEVAFSAVAAQAKVMVDQSMLDQVQGIFLAELDRLITACEAELQRLGVELEQPKAGLRVVDKDKP